MELKSPKGNLVAAAIGAAGVAGFLLGGAAKQDTTVFGPTVAAWVQALGSIAAIAAGFSLARQEARAAAEKEEKARQDARTTAREAARALARMTVMRADNSYAHLTELQHRHNIQLWIAKTSLDNQAQMVSGFEITRLEDPTLMLLFAAFPGVLAASAERCAQFAQRTQSVNIGVDGDEWRVFLDTLRKLRDAARTRLAEFEAALAGATPDTFDLTVEIT